LFIDNFLGEEVHFFLGYVRNFIFGISAFLIIMLLGGFAIHSFENVSYFHGIYYAFLSMSTLGPQFHAQSREGIVSTIIITFLGVGTALYIFYIFCINNHRR
jgi:hypothetical protein